MTIGEINLLLILSICIVIGLFTSDFLWFLQPLRSWEGRILILMLIILTTALSYLIWWMNH